MGEWTFWVSALLRANLMLPEWGLDSGVGRPFESRLLVDFQLKSKEEFWQGRDSDNILHE